MQIALFYVFPASVLALILIFLLTFALSVLSGAKLSGRVKYLHPLLCLAFVPAVYLFYNSSALFYLPVFMVDSALGIGIGARVRKGGSENK